MFTVTTDRSNMDLLPGETRAQARERYLDMWDDFQGLIGDPVVHEYAGGRFILRADLSAAGFKAFGAEKLVAETKSDTLVYVAPRVGHAPDAIAWLARQYGKRVVFFCPAASEPSMHQRALLAYDNTELRFVRIAAMPVLNKYARDWALKAGATYMPFGLTGTPIVTAGMVHAATRASAEIGKDPSAVFCAVSTGTMVRALQIGWPEAEIYGVAVARNIHKGEIGEAEVHPHHMPFLKPLPMNELPPFPTTTNYDAKAWELFETLNIPGSIFINVGSDNHIERNSRRVAALKIDSRRDWGDMEDLEPWHKYRSGVLRSKTCTL